MAAATTPVKSLPAARPRAPPVLPWVLPELEGRGELDDEDPELLGGVDETEEEMREEVPLGLGTELEPPIGRELAPLICCCSSAVKVPVIPVNSNLAENANAGY
jgi:hypothetical protein